MRRLLLAILLGAWILQPDPVFRVLPYRADPSWPELPGGFNLGETAGVAVDAERNIYLFHRGARPLVKLDSAGKFLASFGEGMFERPHSIRFDKDGNLWAADAGSHIVIQMDRRGRVRLVFGRRGDKSEKEDRFNQPTDMAFSSDGSVYITDGYGNSRVVQYSREGRFVRAWGRKGPGEGEFNLPHTIVIDAQDRIYVGDRENHRIQIFDTQGRFLRQWTHVGSPWGLHLQGETLWMADGHNNRVLKLALDGTVIGTTGSAGRLPGQFLFAHMIAADDRDNFYVTEILNWRAQKFVRSSAE